MDEFDRLLYVSSAQLPPELAELKPPCPWKRPVGLICWGVALVTITLNFFGLNYVLPAAGAVLLWWGLSLLRRENGAFRFARACAALYAVLRLTSVLLQATPLDHWLAEHIGHGWYTTAGPVPLWYALRVAVLQLILVLTVCGLWRGLKGVFTQAGQKPRTAAAGGLVILEALMIPLTLIGVDGLLAWAVLLVWVCLLVSLRSIGKSLDQAGYALKPAPMGISGRLALVVWLGLHLLCIAALPLVFARLPVNSQTPVYESVDNSSLRAGLLELGFPEDIMSRLDDSELSRYEGFYGLKTDGGYDGEGSFPDDMPAIVTVEVPVRDERYEFRNVYLAYLRWNPNESSGGYMEGIQVTPDLHGVSFRTTCPDGVLKWKNSAGADCVMPLDFRFDTDSFGLPCYVVNFSLPEEVSGPLEGFLFWETTPSMPDLPIYYNYHVTIAHRCSFWQYPYTLPSDVLARGFFDTPYWQWRLFQRASEGQLAPEGMYDPNKY